MRKRTRAAVPSETPVVDRLLDEIQSLQETLAQIELERTVQQAAVNRLWTVLRDAAQERGLETFAISVADLLVEYGVMDDRGRKLLRESGWPPFPRAETDNDAD